MPESPSTRDSSQSSQAPADACPVRRFDHLEFFVGNARQAAWYYVHCFGFRVIAYRGLETGSRNIASYVLEQGEIRFVLTSGLSPEHPAAQSAHLHGDCVGVIALEVDDAAAAYTGALSRGAEGAIEPARMESEDGVFAHAAIRLYGDTILQFIERQNFRGLFAPGFHPVEGPAAAETQGPPLMETVDHVVANVPLGEMDTWVQFFSRVLGFSQLAHFDDEAISTEYSALMSKVMQDGEGRVKFPINEPAQGRRKSQIEEFLDYYRGPGVQHIACSTSDILTTVARLRENGVQFLRVPRNYYDDLERRVGKIDEPIDRLADLGILVDRDEEGYLLQVFTQPVEDRPTLFFEIIERHGSRGFGEGNFKSLFESIEREQALRGNL